MVQVIRHRDPEKRPCKGIKLVSSKGKTLTEIYEITKHMVDSSLEGWTLAELQRVCSVWNGEEA